MNKDGKKITGKEDFMRCFRLVFTFFFLIILQIKQKSVFHKQITESAAWFFELKKKQFRWCSSL